jgi:hypothetical protein
MVDDEEGHYFIGGLVTSPEIEGVQAAVWATNRDYDPHSWGPRGLGDIVPVNPVAMTVSRQQHQPWVTPEWAQSASRRIGKEPTLISMVSMSDRGAQRAAECVEEYKANPIPPGFPTFVTPYAVRALERRRGVLLQATGGTASRALRSPSICPYMYLTHRTAPL